MAKISSLRYSYDHKTQTITNHRQSLDRLTQLPIEAAQTLDRLLSLLRFQLTQGRMPKATHDDDEQTLLALFYSYWEE